MEDQLLEDL